MHAIMIQFSSFISSTKWHGSQTGACLQAAGISNAVELGSSDLKSAISYIIEVVPLIK